MRVLVVDDEKLLVKGIKFNLENDGYQVDTARRTWLWCGTKSTTSSFWT